MTTVVWITGRPASGKTTLGRRLVRALCELGVRATLLDSDEARASITPRPTYVPEERALFYRALAFTAATLAREGIVSVVAATAHDASLRAELRVMLDDLFLVHARCPLDVCEARDPKGLYRAARARRGGTFPGVDVPYDEPHDADVVVDTAREVSPGDLDALVAQIGRRDADRAEGRAGYARCTPRDA